MLSDTDRFRRLRQKSSVGAARMPTGIVWELRLLFKAFVVRIVDCWTDGWLLLLCRNPHISTQHNCLSLDPLLMATCGHAYAEDNTEGNGWHEGSGRHGTDCGTHHPWRKFTVGLPEFHMTQPFQLGWLTDLISPNPSKFNLESKGLAGSPSFTPYFKSSLCPTGINFKLARSSTKGLINSFAHSTVPLLLLWLTSETSSV